MNSAIKKLLLVLRSARLVLWVPILANTVVLTFLLGHSLLNGFVLGLSLSSVAAYGFLINDVWDLRVDRENHAGKLEGVSKSVLFLAAGSSGFFLILGLSISALVGVRAMLAMLAVATGLTAYTFWVRPKLFFANLLAAFLASTPIWLPNVIFSLWPNVAQWIIIIFAAAVLMGREIIFDVADVFGDGKVNRRTLPIQLGGQVAARIAVILQISGFALLMAFCMTAVWSLPLVTCMLLCGVLTIFGLLVIPVNLQLLVAPQSLERIQLFTLRTRYAMLLLPLIMFILLSK